MEQQKKDKKVWVMDDDSGILEVIKIVLDEEGYTTTMIKNEKELKDQLIHSFPDILLLDVLMSGMDGREISKSLKQSDKTKHIPIIIMSADTDIETKTEEALANDFLPKPFDIVKLIQKVEHWV